MFIQPVKIFFKAKEKRVKSSFDVSYKTFSPQYLIEAPCCAIFAAWCEVPQLDVEQIHQLNHGLNCVGDVSCLEITLSLLRQLPGNDCSCLSSF